MNGNQMFQIKKPPTVARLGNTPGKTLPVPAHEPRCHAATTAPVVLSTVLDGPIVHYRCTRCTARTWSLVDGKGRTPGTQGSFRDPCWRSVQEIEAAAQGRPVTRIPPKPAPNEYAPRHGGRMAA